MKRQQMILDEQREQMLANWRKTNHGTDHDPHPVVKLFNPCGAATWLLTEIVEHDPNIAFGLCDLGMGEPELGYVSLDELSGIELWGGALYIERDEHFTPTKPLSEYAREARRLGRIEVC